MGIISQSILLIQCNSPWIKLCCLQCFLLYSGTKNPACSKFKKAKKEKSSVYREKLRTTITITQRANSIPSTMTTGSHFCPKIRKKVYSIL